MMDLFIGNKNYSTWSLRPWLVLKVFNIPFTAHWIAFDDFKLSSPFKQKMITIHPTAKVPALKHDDVILADSLAICEYLAELYPEKHLWPQEIAARAQARSICAEMHSGFGGLRSACPMNIEADLSAVGLALWQSNATLRQDVERIQEIWAARPSQNGFLCGENFSIADAFYAPVILRMLGYGLAISEYNQAYVQRILALPALQQWMTDARLEHCFVVIDEPYRTAPSV